MIFTLITTSSSFYTSRDCLFPKNNVFWVHRTNSSKKIFSECCISLKLYFYEISFYLIHILFNVTALLVKFRSFYVCNFVEIHQKGNYKHYRAAIFKQSFESVVDRGREIFVPLVFKANLIWNFNCLKFLISNFSTLIAHDSCVFVVGWMLFYRMLLCYLLNLKLRFLDINF